MSCSGSGSSAHRPRTPDWTRSTEPLRGLLASTGPGPYHRDWVWLGVTRGKPCSVDGPAGMQHRVPDLMTSPSDPFAWAIQGVAVAATFELFQDKSTSFGFRLKASDGALVAVSGRFPDKASAVEGIRTVRECAGTGLITDLCPILSVAVPEQPNPSAATAIA
jgi:uncharacterized protein YegP (UPF0339 family)